jgi:hypothetical protein
MTPTFHGEVMLLDWSESHRGGAKVVFLLADRDDLDVFRLMTVAKGKKAGQRLACVLVEIGDDEQPKPPPEPAKYREGPQTPAEDRKGGPLAKLAGMWCNSPDFQEWSGYRTPEDARMFILHNCGIESRADLDHNEEAARLFHHLIRIQYSGWLKETGRAACQVT